MATEIELAWTRARLDASSPRGLPLTLSVGAVAIAVGYVQAIRVGESAVGLGVIRLVFGTSCYVAEAIGAALLIAGQIAGLYVAAVALILLLAFMISGAWLLIVDRGVTQGGAVLSHGFFEDMGRAATVVSKPPAKSGS